MEKLKPKEAKQLICMRSLNYTNLVNSQAYALHLPAVVEMRMQND